MRKEEKIFILFALFFFLTVLPSTTFADITIGSPVFTPNKATFNPGDSIIITIPVSSNNSITNVLMEIINSSLDMSNSTTQNYTLTLVGPDTNGNWLYVSNFSSGIYQITHFFATDNTSFVQTADLSLTFVGFKVTGPTSTTTTTTTQTSATATSTSVTTTTTAPTSQSSPFDALSFIFSNPIYIVIIAVIIILPISLVIFFMKKKPKDELPEPGPDNAPPAPPAPSAPV